MTIPLEAAPLHTHYAVECWRRGVCIWTESFHNLVTTAGRNQLLDAVFRTGKAANAWFVGLVTSTPFTAYAAADTMASHAGWTENAAYAEATRPAFVPAAAAAAAITNSASKAVFTINLYTTIRGAFLVDVATKSGATGTLYGIGDFASLRTVVNGDVLRVTITVSD